VKIGDGVIPEAGHWNIERRVSEYVSNDHMRGSGCSNEPLTSGVDYSSLWEPN
jgi:hypothetical protein